MADRNNIEDIYKIVKEDFDWIIEDMEQHIYLIKENMVEFIKNNPLESIEDFQGKIRYIDKLIEKVKDIKAEYISIIKGEEGNKKIIDGIEYDYLEDWRGTNPKEIVLFGEKHEVKFWRDILIIVIDELYKKDPKLIYKIAGDKNFRGRKRVYFTFDEKLIEKKYYKKTSSGLYVIVNADANTLYTLSVQILEMSGFIEDDLKIVLSKDDCVKLKEENKIEKDDSSNIIKLSKEYASVSMDKSIFKTLIYSIINRKKEYGTNYIEPRKIANKYEKLLLNNTNYAIPYHPVINIINFLKDSHFIDNYEGTRKGKYLVVDDTSLKTWVDNNF